MFQGYIEQGQIRYAVIPNEPENDCLALMPHALIRMGRHLDQHRHLVFPFGFFVTAPGVFGVSALEFSLLYRSSGAGIRDKRNLRVGGGAFRIL